MKSIQIALFIAFSLLTIGCASTQSRTEWIVDTQDRSKYDQFLAVYNECKDFAYRSKVAGSKYSEGDIHTSCIQRKGYEFKTVQGTSN